MERGRALGHPPGKACKPGMGAQSLDRGIVSRKVGFRNRGVNFIVANLVQQHGWSPFATTKLWYQVMQALFRVRRDRAQAQRADRVGHSVQLIWGPAGMIPKGLRNSDGEK